MIVISPTLKGLHDTLRRLQAVEMTSCIKYGGMWRITVTIRGEL